MVRNGNYLSGPKSSAYSLVLLLVIMLVAVLRIASTYSVFSNTFDENGHLGPAMEWLDAGTYHYEPQHPPMRAVFAIGPRLLGIHHFGEPLYGDEGSRILGADGKYWRNLTAARVAALPFFAFTIFLVFHWARRLAGAAAGLLGALAYSTLPLALGHAGLVGNDTLLAAMLTLALYAWLCWLKQPDTRRALLLGLAVAAAVLAKFTALLFLASVMGLTGLLWLLRARGTGPRETGVGHVPARMSQRCRILGRSIGFAALSALLLIWAGYRFSMGPVTDPAVRPHHTLDRVFGATGIAHEAVYKLLGATVPAPEFIQGIQTLWDYNKFPPASYLMGQINEKGFVAFFPIGILVKTPVPFLILALGGLILLLQRAWRDDNPSFLVPPLAAIAIVASCLPAKLNIGVRHVLPAFPMLAVGAGVFASVAWRFAAAQTARWRSLVCKSVLVFLFAWQVITGVRAHPDYLAYFNECCSRNPQYWLIGSDLDWGQDLKRLSDELRRRSITSIHLACFSTADPAVLGMPFAVQLKPYERVHGWVAASEFRLVLGTYVKPYDQYRWLLDYRPVARVGKSIRLYYFP